MKSYYYILDITSGEYITDLKFFNKKYALIYLAKYAQVSKRSSTEFDFVLQSEE